MTVTDLHTVFYYLLTIFSAVFNTELQTRQLARSKESITYFFSVKKTCIFANFYAVKRVKDKPVLSVTV